ncbi:hypothetical protein C942_00550 [Photobacterium marinum]|uniref:Porin n=1 Tax=Photobacterium marinum TaxID=1056511 RepID=L8JEG1_9GAMM|nr:hypothetical protein [Photobacterium marinum]ELR65924.1 hypothetical protein C942_00550 [Photobacterium marinum]
MNKSLLSVLIVNALAAGYAHAEVAPSDTSNTFDQLVNVVTNVNGHVGVAYEFKETEFTNYSDPTQTYTEKHKENSYIDGFYNFNDLNLFGNYKITQITNSIRKNNGEFLNEETVKYELSTNYRYVLSESLNTGLGYSLEYEDGYAIESNSGRSDRKINTTEAQHEFSTWLGYWNNEGQWGFYSDASVGWKDADKNQWGDADTDLYHVSFKPFMNLGKFFMAAELYYENQDTTNSWKENIDFTERYIEPELAYSFGEGKRVFVKHRFSEKETNTSRSNGSSTKYFENINKTTLGYQQTIGEKWWVSAEVELIREKHDMDDKKFADKDSDNFKLFAQYRF